MTARLSDSEWALLKADGLGQERGVYSVSAMEKPTVAWKESGMDPVMAPERETDLEFSRVWMWAIKWGMRKVQ